MSDPHDVAGRVLNKAARVARAAAGRLEAASRRYQPTDGSVGPRVAHSTGSSFRVPASHDTGDIVWFHSIDLGDGQVTPGVKSVATLQAQSISLNLPATLHGSSVLDIGAWDGYFSFDMEQRGAASVTALDHYAWSTNHTRYGAYHIAAIAGGDRVFPPDEVSEAWDPVNLPGRAGFDQARAALGSRVQPVVGDFMTMDLGGLGQFDIVLFLGVLYHLKDPFLALRRLRQVTRGVAVIETAGVVLPGWTDERLWMFFEGAELNNDAGNWWAPSSAGLLAMCRAAGFSNTRLLLEPLEYSPPGPGYTLHYGRIVAHAYA
jgi:tRNA (mo5U34)-methyltransferase